MQNRNRMHCDSCNEWNPICHACQRRRAERAEARLEEVEQANRWLRQQVRIARQRWSDLLRRKNR
jgi:hypothetical protein